MSSVVLAFIAIAMIMMIGRHRRHNRQFWVRADGVYTVIRRIGIATISAAHICVIIYIIITRGTILFVIIEIWLHYWRFGKTVGEVYHHLWEWIDERHLVINRILIGKTVIWLCIVFAVIIVAKLRMMVDGIAAVQFIEWRFGPGPRIDQWCFRSRRQYLFWLGAV